MLAPWSVVEVPLSGCVGRHGPVTCCAVSTSRSGSWINAGSTVSFPSSCCAACSQCCGAGEFRAHGV
eukprot:2294845-Amphidinium_carterae.1